MSSSRGSSPTSMDMVSRTSRGGGEGSSAAMGGAAAPGTVTGAAEGSSGSARRKSGTMNASASAV